MTTFPIKKLSEITPGQEIAKMLENAGMQRMELSGTYLCDPGDCKHRYNKWEPSTVVIEIDSHEEKFKAKSRKCLKCGSYDVLILGK